jgi:hypothetical protein
MSTFKVTLHINDGLALGSVLMTKGVELIHIVETFGHESKIMEQKLLTNNGKRKMVFRSPDGKLMTDFIVDYISKSDTKTRKWKEINSFVKSKGFGRSSINSALTRLVANNIIKRIEIGTYMLIKEEN